ncbi:MAG: heparinase II/III family protein, partial [Nanoarchaeota archaeon]
KSIEKHGEFLADERHFELGYNHGVNQATALFLISYNFPDFNQSSAWRGLAIQRFENGLSSLIDEDGVLLENSPYYQFYVLQKYWEILKYSKKYNIQIAKNLEEKLDLMMSYSANIIQPNLEIPLLGASLKQTIRYSKYMKEIADSYPPLLYALTQGEKGESLSDAVY